MQRFFRILSLLAGLTLVGTAWFRIVDGWPLTDSIYMTVITLTTVGYTEVRPLNDHDKLFICIYLAFGLGVFLYGAVQIGESIVRAELGDWWRQRNMSQSISSLRDHFIVCGGGRMGRLLCEDLAGREIPFVVVDSDPTVAAACEERGWNTICADATDDEALTEAGIADCVGLAATLASDADNLYVVVSARLLHATVQIVARAHDDRSASKLKRAGANRVVSPYESGAAKMGQLLTNPNLNDFVEIISDRNVAFDIVGLPVTNSSPWVGKPLVETDLRKQGVMIVAIRHSDGRVELAPVGETTVNVGDELFAFGETSAIRGVS